MPHKAKLATLKQPKVKFLQKFFFCFHALECVKTIKGKEEMSLVYEGECLTEPSKLY